MNFVSIFSKKVEIAGIEVNDSNVRLVALAYPKRSPVPVVTHAASIPLASGIVVGSTVRDVPKLAAALQKLVAQSGFRGNYAIASIPMAEVYAKVFTFPQTVIGQKLQDAMTLAVDFQNPIAPENGYSDWETMHDSSENEALFLSLPRVVADGYMDAFSKADIKLVALETHPQSLCRSLDTKPSDAVLFTNAQATSCSFCVLKHRSIRMCMSVMGQLGKMALQEQEQRVRHAYESSIDTLKASVSLAKAPLIKPFGNEPRFRNSPGTFVIALGAALRGLIPRSHDTDISLLPVGTEEAYDYQRASVFSEFIGTVSVALAVFFCVAFLGAWGFMSRLQASVQTQLASSLSLTPPIDAPEVETRAREFNAIASTAATLIRTQPRWNSVMQAVSKHMVPGVTVTSLTFPAPEQTFSVNGTAESRAALVALRKSFEESDQFVDVNVPLTNLELKEKIPFSLTWKFADPSSVYPQ